MNEETWMQWIYLAFLIIIEIIVDLVTVHCSPVYLINDNDTLATVISAILQNFSL